MGHTYTDIVLHVVFSTAERRPTIDESFRERLCKYMVGIARQEFGKALEIGGVADHVHGLISLRANVSLAEAMRDWKALSSKWINEVIQPRQRFAWQTGYSPFSVSRSQTSKVVNYILSQEQHHRKMSFKDEVFTLLKKHQIEHDLNYLWD